MKTRSRISASTHQHGARDSSMTASVSVWRISLPRLAPSADRTPVPARVPRHGLKTGWHVGAGNQQHCQHRAQQHPRGFVRVRHLPVAYRAHLQVKIFRISAGIHCCVCRNRGSISALASARSLQASTRKSPQRVTNAAVHLFCSADRSAPA